MRVEFLGTGSCLPDNEATDTASLLIERHIMVDTGWNPIRNLLQAGVEPGQVTHLFFTHMHQDHYLGLAQFLFYRITKYQRVDDLTIYGPEGLEEVVRRTLMYAGFDEIVVGGERRPVADEKPHVVELPGEGEYELNGFSVRFIKSLHTTPSRCYRFTDANGKSIVYTSRKKTGMEYSLSTNSDLYLYNIEDGTTRNLTEGMMGYDTNPVFSPDGNYLAWTSMERDGYESDKNRLFILDMQSGEKTYLTENFDYIVNTFAWAPDASMIYFTSPYQGMVHIFSVALNGLAIQQITEGYYDYATVYPAANNKLVAQRHSISSPDEIYVIDLDTRQAANLSHENDNMLAQIEMGNVEERWIPTTDGKQMLAWVVYPPHFDANKKYPAILYCQGGPQSPVSQFWSYRWNLQLIAAQGYIVVAPNRHGLPGFGQEWLEQISKDYGGQCMSDYFAAADNIKAEPFVGKMGAVGASFGGFSVYWLAGHHEKRFDAFIAHAGIFNLEQQYMETEEMWFANWDMGGAPWDKNNAIAQRTFANSPHRFVGEWDTPILCIHGEKDFRILASQGMSAFNAAKLRGIPAELLIFPDENHWILKPQNGMLFHRTFIGWLDRWLKPAE